MSSDHRAVAERRYRAARSAATRYLCFGAQTDEDFAGDVIQALLRERWRHVAPSYGMDVIPILAHCLRARRRHALRDLTLIVLLAAYGTLLVRTGSVLLATLRHAEISSATGSMLRAAGVRQVPSVLTATVVVLALAALVRMADWAWGRVVVARRLVARRFDPEAGPGILFPGAAMRMEDIDREQFGHVTWYDARSPTPFVGAGPLIASGNWSFALDLRRKAENPMDAPREIGAFRPLDLYEHVQEELWKLRDPGRGPEYALPDLEISDHVFVSGLTPPRLTAELDRIANVPEGLLRHFQCVRVESWGGELVVTMFLHLGTQGSTLYVEFTPCLLPPIRSRYHAPDTQPFPSAGEWLYEAVSAWWGAPGAAVGAPGRLLKSWFGAHDDVPEPPEERHSPRDRGARTSVRLLGADREPNHHFQWLDARKYQKVIELQVLNAIIQFLDDRHIDTTDLRARQNTILNQGVIVSNSTVQQIAAVVGEGGQASVNGSPPSAPSTPAAAAGTTGATP